MTKDNCLPDGTCPRLISLARPATALGGSELLTRKEAASYLGVTPETLAVWHSTKRYPLPMVKIGRLCKYKKSDLDAFIALRTIGVVGA